MQETIAPIIVPKEEAIDLEAPIKVTVEEAIDLTYLDDDDEEDVSVSYHI